MRPRERTETKVRKSLVTLLYSTETQGEKGKNKGLNACRSKEVKPGAVSCKNGPAMDQREQRSTQATKFRFKQFSKQHTTEREKWVLVVRHF